MVRHETVGMQNAAAGTEQSPEMQQIEASILVLEEARAAIVPALHDMHGDAGKHDSGASGHEP